MTVPIDIVRVGDEIWEIPKSHKEGMVVPARIIASEALLAGMDDGVFDQITNVATLPGVVGYALCMPDGHWGYGFPIGGVAAMDPEVGVISPGGIGFDINCGMRLVTTDLVYDEVRPRLKELVDRLFRRVPAGVGGHGFVRISRDEFREALVKGSRWCLERGYAWPEDLERTEEGGCIPGADPEKVSDRAVERGIYVRSVSFSGLAEEAGAAYKPIDEVVAATVQAGISRPVVRFVPIGNVKG